MVNKFLLLKGSVMIVIVLILFGQRIILVQLKIFCFYNNANGVRSYWDILYNSIRKSHFLERLLRLQKIEGCCCYRDKNQNHNNKSSRFWNKKAKRCYIFIIIKKIYIYIQKASHICCCVFLTFLLLFLFTRFCFFCYVWISVCYRVFRQVP